MHYLVRPTILAAVAVATFASCGGTLSPRLRSGSGILAVQLTDAAFLAEEVLSADLFIVRLEARLEGADSVVATPGASDDRGLGWITVARPNASVNLLDYQYRVVLPLASASIPAGSYRGFRLVIDPSRSSLTLAGGTVITTTSLPNVRFPENTPQGLRIFLRQPIIISEGETTTVRVDFALDEMLMLRGNSIAEKGVVFHPILRGTVQPR